MLYCIVLLYMNANCRNGWTSNVVSHFIRTSTTYTQTQTNWPNRKSVWNKPSWFVCVRSPGAGRRLCSPDISPDTSHGLSRIWNETRNCDRCHKHLSPQRIFCPETESVVTSSSVTLAIGETKKTASSLFSFKFSRICLPWNKTLANPSHTQFVYPKLRSRNKNKKQTMKPTELKSQHASFVDQIHPFDLSSFVTANHTAIDRHATGRAFSVSSIP